MKKKLKMGEIDADVVRAVKANEERCRRNESIKGQIACRAIGLEVALGIGDKKAKGKEIQEELDAGFRKCMKKYDTKDGSREIELMGCASGMDEIVSAFGYRTIWDPAKKIWKAAPKGGNGNGMSGKSRRRRK